jgi:ATP-dependent phosphofructokinase / diphosphate-dependent phosphofructokinase
VPGLNPAIRAITIRALREGYRVLGIRRGWAGLVDLVPDARRRQQRQRRRADGGRS